MINERGGNDTFATSSLVSGAIAAETDVDELCYDRIEYATERYGSGVEAELEYTSKVLSLHRLASEFRDAEVNNRKISKFSSRSDRSVVAMRFRMDYDMLAATDLKPPFYKVSS